MSAVDDGGKILDPIATVRGCYGEKFAVPRQPGLAPSARGRLVFERGYRHADAVRGLDGFSHLWLIFGFHRTAATAWSPTVRPPRLGGNRRVGVFASRSTHRPNGLGLSLVRLAGIDFEADDAPVLWLDGIDLVDGTPVYDVKPYLSFVESVPDATGGYAEAEWPRLEVRGEDRLALMEPRDRRVVIESLALDPRPATGRDEREFGAALCGWNVRFRVIDGVCEILGLEPGKGGGERR
jgi:tRNA-Thr(GGU) m(6)t(6)A37 methyltransferase TsaA